MQKEQLNQVKSVVFLGDSGFPIGLAHIQRITLLGRALINAGCDINVVCRMWVWRSNVKTHYGKTGVHEGIQYHYTVDSPFRPKSFSERQYQRIKGLIKEFFYLKRLKKESKLDAAILSTMNFYDALRYKFYSVILGFPIAVNLVEMASALERRSSMSKQFSNWLMENWLLKKFDGAMPISDKLCEFYTEIAPEKPMMKIPVICDYDKFAQVQRKPSEPYFLYCASISFMNVVEFVMDAYEAMKGKEFVKLYLLIGVRKEEQLNELRKKISQRFTEGSVHLYSNVSYEVLMQLFTNAKSLIIPLRHTVEDAARFPHKIGEYLATGNPVITTNVGEIKTYFEDGKTAFVSEHYDVNEFAEKMDMAASLTNKAKQIGMMGKHLGEENFHYVTYGKKLKNFLEILKKN